MSLSPQEENGIVLMILRDTHNILSHTPNFSFDYNANVKLQKVVFLLADALNIPLTRSWYHFGPFVYNKNVKFEKLSYFPAILNEETRTEISEAEKIISERRENYYKQLNLLVPRLFFMKLDDLLAEVYGKYAPAPYKPVYFSNLNLNKDFKLAKSRVSCDEEVISRFTNNLSILTANLASFEDMSFMYDYADEFATTLESCLIKMSSSGKVSIGHLGMLKATYEAAIWNPVSLKISINTLTGSNTEPVKLEQYDKLVKNEPYIKHRLAFLENILSKNAMLASINDKSEFFKSRYGDDKKFVDAVVNVWKSYK